MTSVDEILDAAFEYPRRLLGRVGTKVMTMCDVSAERVLIRLADPRKDDDVLLLEPGAGVAVREATKASTVTALEDSRENGRVPATEDLARDSVDVVLSVNGMQRWSDRQETFTELARILRPQGRLLLSVHERWAGVSAEDLAAVVRTAGFVDVQAWRWKGPFGTIAVQLRARSGKRDGGDATQRDHRADDPPAGV